MMNQLARGRARAGHCRSGSSMAMGRMDVDGTVPFINDLGVDGAQMPLFCCIYPTHDITTLLP